MLPKVILFEFFTYTLHRHHSATLGHMGNSIIALYCELGREYNSTLRRYATCAPTTARLYIPFAVEQASRFQFGIRFADILPHGARHFGVHIDFNTCRGFLQSPTLFRTGMNHFTAEESGSNAPENIGQINKTGPAAGCPMQYSS